MAIYDSSGNEIIINVSNTAFRDSAYLFKLKNLNDQGMCTDGTYIYSCDGTNIHKYNILTKDTTTESFTTDYYGHANDMTYNPNTGYLYIATMTSGQAVGVVNASTLAHVDFIDLKKSDNTSIYPSQIAYDWANNRYIVAHNDDFMIYDSSFSYVSAFDGNHGGVHQGIDTDGKYIYKCRSAVSSRGIVQVIDFSGNTLKQIDVTGYEIEGISWDWKGNWYINTKNSQGLYYASLFEMLNAEGIEQFHKILGAYTS